MKNRFFIILPSLAMLCCEVANEYREYIPVFHNGNNLYQATDSLTEVHKKNIQHVREILIENCYGIIALKPMI